MGCQAGKGVAGVVAATSHDEQRVADVAAGRQARQVHAGLLRQAWHLTTGGRGAAKRKVGSSGIHQAAAQWRGMSDRGSCTANHQDHVHVSFIGPDVAPAVPEVAPDEATTDQKSGN